MTMRKLITFRRIGLYLSLAAIVLWVESAVAEIWFVNLANDTGTEDGTSWETALVAIQPGVDAAFESGGGEVWVANGVYSELREGTVDVEPDPVEEILVESGSLVTKPGVNLYGGFLGTESLLEERDPNPRLSVIDGSRSRGGDCSSRRSSFQPAGSSASLRLAFLPLFRLGPALLLSCSDSSQRSRKRSAFRKTCRWARRLPIRVEGALLRSP